MHTFSILNKKLLIAILCIFGFNLFAALSPSWPCGFRWQHNCSFEPNAPAGISISSGDIINFVNTSQCVGPDGWVWDFGNGDYAYTADASETFYNYTTNPATYIVYLSTYDPYWGTLSFSTTVIVNPNVSPPTPVSKSFFLFFSRTRL